MNFLQFSFLRKLIVFLLYDIITIVVVIIFSIFFYFLTIFPILSSKRLDKPVKIVLK